MSSLARTFSSPFHSKAAQGARKFMSLQTSNASKALSSEIQELFKERTLTKKRKKIVHEIIESEKSYQHHLQLLISLFLVPIKVGGLLPKSAIEAIFGNIEGICSVNLQLLELMETEDVATALYKLAPFMKLYSLYANNFEKSNKTIEEQEKKNPHFLTFKESQENKEEMQGLKLRALLITPIQRIPRYKLLLETLLEKTTPDHPDYKKLHDACYEISNVATHINECLRLHENFNKMLSIQNSLVGDSAPRILAPGRKFLREGMLSKVCERGGSKDRMFFLFNDILIYAKKETSCTYSCRGVFPLINCIVEQVMGGTRGPSEGGALFKVFCKGKTLLLFSTSKQNARSWVKDIKNAISELHTNLASLRRGDTDPFTPPDAAFKRDSKMRRSKAAKELLKKNEAMSPLQHLRACASPKQDILYPMRNDILPQLAENPTYPYFDAYEEKTKFNLQYCMTSAKKERSVKPRLRRWEVEDSSANDLQEKKDEKESSGTNNGYDLRSRSRKRTYASMTGNIPKSPNIFGSSKLSAKRGSQNERLIGSLNEKDRVNSSPGCFGSGKKSRKMEEGEAYGMNERHDGSFLEIKEDENGNQTINEDTTAERNQRSERLNNKLSMEVTVKSYYQNMNTDQKNSIKKAEDCPKTWSLTDETNIPKKRQRKQQRKGIVYWAKSKVLQVSRGRRNKRRANASHPYRAQTMRSQSANDHCHQNENTSLLYGTEGTFKQIGTPLNSHKINEMDENAKNEATCSIM